MVTEIVRALFQHEADIEDDEPQTKTYFESTDSKTRIDNRYNKTNKETSGEEDYIEAKKHALWYGGVDRIHAAAAITPTRLPFRLKTISTKDEASTPETQKSHHRKRNP